MTITEQTLEIKNVDSKGRLSLGSSHAGKRYAVSEQPDGSTLLTPVIVMLETTSHITQDRISALFAPIENLKTNWDGNGSLAPKPAMLQYARDFLGMLIGAAVAGGHPFTNPLVSVDHRGYITLEWWDKSRSLTVYIADDNAIEYLKAWGTDITSDMEDGSVTLLTDVISLLKWLYAVDEN
jgi:hypothetical protein